MFTLTPLNSDQIRLVNTHMKRLRDELVHTNQLGGILKDTRQEAFCNKTVLFLRKLQDIVEIWVRTTPDKSLDDAVRAWADYWCTKTTSTS